MRKRLMKSVGLGSVKFEGVFCIVSIIFIFLVFNEAIFAGEKNQSIKKNFRHQWRIEQNVPRFGVLSVKQTPDGYLWLGTQEGLVRYDGVQHVVFNKDNTEAINNNVVQFLLVARSGALWLGTMGGGLVKYQDGLFTRYEISEGLSGNFVQGIAESADGTLWVGTNKGLSALLPDGNIIKNEASAVLAGKTINAVFADADETIWIGTYGDGLYSFKDGKLTQYTEKEGLLSNSVWSLAGDEKGNLWIGTRDGISRFDRRSFINYETSESGAGQTIFSVLTNRSPNILFGTGSGGVLSFDGDKFSTTGEKDGLPSDNVNSLFQDREGNIWAGTLGGLARLFEPPIETLTQADGLRGGIVSAIYEEKPGRIWIGTNEGLNLFENGKFADAPLIKAVGRTPVYSILDDGAGSLLIGTKGKGLFQLKKNRITQLSTANGLPNDVIFTLLKGKQGDLWIGTYGGGLVKVTPDKKLSIYTVKNGLISNLISALHEDGAGRLWIVTKDGISRFFEGKFENFALGENGLPSNEIYAVREAPRDSGNVWLGTDGGGLVRYKNGNFRVVSRADGLTQDAVFGLKDDDKSLWLAGSRGISRISLTQLNEKLNGNQQLLRPLEFGIAEGMASEYCVGGSQSVCGSAQLKELLLSIRLNSNRTQLCRRLSLRRL
jgi:ligand-binding sensor domain-containing protein